MKSIEVLLCFVLGVIFISSSVPKLRNPRGFVLIVLEYRILPPSIAFLYGRVLPPLEFLLALLLFTGTMVYLAAIVTGLLLVSFIVAMSMNIVRGRDLDCHCFGSKIQRKISWTLVLQDGLLLCAAIALVFVASMSVISEPWSIFRIIGPLSYSFLPFALCLGLTGAVSVLLRYLKVGGSRSFKARYTGK
jgi:hypothetical protein